MKQNLRFNSVEPFFFGNSNRRLYGCYHSPPNESIAKGIVVLCQTIGKEYIHSHRAFFQLATRLAFRGFATLRFDYFGCGDSAGDFENGGLEDWGADVDTAIDEIQLRSGHQDVCLVGFRVGALLALQSALRSEVVKYLVLWEIVHNGANYLEEAVQLQVELSRTLKTRTRKSKEDNSLPTELQGFPLTPHLIRDLKELKVTDTIMPPNCKSLTVFNREVAPSEFTLNSETPYEENKHVIRCVKDARLWEEELYQRLIPVNTINVISEWIEGIAS